MLWVTYIKLDGSQRHSLLAHREPTTYSLKDRGLRIVTGRNEDQPSFDSNGAGKSALVTAPLWCLTGRSTPAGEVSRASQVIQARPSSVCTLQTSVALTGVSHRVIVYDHL